MAKVRVIARAAFWYDGRDRRVGERFDASSEDARLLQLANRVRIIERKTIVTETPDAERVDAPATSRVRRTRRADPVDVA